MYKGYLRRRENIIICAIDILDEAGIQGLTTREIARRQGITEAAVYKQFTGKREIILTILDRYACFDEHISDTIVDNGLEGLKALYFFAKAYAEYYENYPQITTVMFSMDVYKYEPETNQRMRSIVEKRTSLITRLISEAQSKGEFRDDSTAEELTTILMGMIWSITYKWKMDNCSGSLKQRIMSTMDLIFGSLFAGDRQ